MKQPCEHCNEVVHQIDRRMRAGRRYRAEMSAELRDHITQQWQELLDDGFTPEQAAKVLMDEFGQVDDLAAELSIPAQRRRTIMKAATGTLGVAAVLALAAILNTQLPPTASHVQATAAPAARLPQAIGSAASLGFNPGLGGVVAGLPYLIQMSANGVPAQINHQGVITVSGTRHDGPGYFKFALMSGTTTVWRNSADNNSDGEPDVAVNLTVTDGIYNVRLGDTTLPPSNSMAALTSELFSMYDNLSLRVWFDDGQHGSQPLSPDQPLTTSPYAFAVADGAISSDKLADGAVSSSKLDATIGIWDKIGQMLTYQGDKIGIGTSSPDGKLDVRGPLYVDSHQIEFSSAVEMSGGGHKDCVIVSPNTAQVYYIEAILMGDWGTGVAGAYVSKAKINVASSLGNLYIENVVEEQWNDGWHHWDVLPGTGSGIVVRVNCAHPTAVTRAHMILRIHTGIGSTNGMIVTMQ